MDMLYSLFFGAGIAGVAYSRLGRRVGYGNEQSVWIIVGVVFVLASIFFYTIIKFIIHTG